MDNDSEKQPVPVEDSPQVVSPARRRAARRSRSIDLRGWFRQRHFLPAFWTITGVVSLTVNIILIVIVYSLAGQLFALKSVISDQLVGGLYSNFVKMDEASIQTSVKVQTNITVEFDLPVKTNTTVKLTEPVMINQAVVSLQTGGLTIESAPTNILLPAGADLPIALDIMVPVYTIVPVTLDVPVTIPLKDTQLHEPFVGLRGVLEPYRTMLNCLPNSWQEALSGKKTAINCK